MASKQNTHFVFFRGTNKLRPKEEDTTHGMTFEKGWVYEVTPRVWEFLKIRIGYSEVRGIKKGIVDFPRK